MASLPVPPRYISLENLAALQAWPTPKIRTDADVEAWKQTQSYSDYSLFLQWLNEAVVGCSLPRTNKNQSEVLYRTLLLGENHIPSPVSTGCSQVA